MGDWELASKGEAVFIIEVKPNRDYTLEIVFANKERKVFDVKPYVDGKKIN